MPEESNESTERVKSEEIISEQPKEKSEELSTPKKNKNKQSAPIKIYVGRRKTSIARVYLVSGSGKFTVNRKSIKEYFPILHLQKRAKEPLALLEMEKKHDVFINVKGGGFRGQAEAISLGIARALSNDDPTFQKKLRSKGLLTRDPRMVERKKYGLHKARRAPQFSKR